MSRLSSPFRLVLRALLLTLSCAATAPAADLLVPLKPVLFSGERPERLDEGAHDHDKKRVYCASPLSKIAIFAMRERRLGKSDEIVRTPGAKSLVVTPKTFNVWTAYAKGDHAFEQAFAVAK